MNHFDWKKQYQFKYNIPTPFKASLDHLPYCQLSLFMLFLFWITDLFFSDFQSGRQYYFFLSTMMPALEIPKINVRKEKVSKNGTVSELPCLP